MTNLNMKTDITKIRNELDKDYILNLFSYIYTQEKSKYTEDELFTQLPENRNKTQIIKIFCECNLLTKDSIYYTKNGNVIYKRLHLPIKFKKEIINYNLSPELKNYFITAISNNYI